MGGTNDKQAVSARCGRGGNPLVHIIQTASKLRGGEEGAGPRRCDRLDLYQQLQELQLQTLVQEEKPNKLLQPGASLLSAQKGISSVVWL